MLYPFNDITDELMEMAGAKAANLCRMTREGFSVPPGAVLSPEAFDRFIETHSDLMKPLIRLLETAPNEEAVHVASAALFEHIPRLTLPKGLLDQVDEYRKELASRGYPAIAVRSSGNLEDTPDASFAGQYETLLNVKTRDQLQKAVLACWASAFNDRVVTYCLRHRYSPADIRLSVVLQAMVPAEASGVAFTVDPMKGSDTVMLIEAVQGLGEALVQGIINPDKYLYDWYKGEILEHRSGGQNSGMFPQAGGDVDWEPVTDPSPAISELELLELGGILLRLQSHFGYPLDIEWAHHLGKFYLLQARPITAIKFDTDQDWTNADCKDGGISSTIATPYMWSLYRMIFSTTMPNFLRQVHIYPDYEPELWATWYLGYPYWNLSAVKNGAKKIPGFVERTFDQDLGIEPDYQGEGHKTKFTPVSLFRGIKILLATNKSIKEREAGCKALLTRAAAVFEQYEASDWKVTGNQEFMEIFREALEKHYLDIESFYFYTIYDNSNATTFYHESLEKYNRKAKVKIQPLKLIGGLEKLSHMRPVYALWELRTAILKDEKAREYFEQQTIARIVNDYQHHKPFPFSDELRAYLTDYPHHSLRELDILVPHWEEDPSQVIDSLKNLLGQEEAQSPALQNEAQRAQYQAEKAKIKSKGLLKKLEIHRNLLWWREEMRDQSTRMYYWLRKLGLEAGARLVKKGTLVTPEDYFFLEFKEALDLFDAALVNPDPEKEKYWQEKIRKNKVYFRCFRNWQKPNEIWAGERRQVEVKPGDPNVLTGIGCSSGYKVATVSVIKDIFEVDQLKEGTVLVTRFTDPAWTPVFARISGLITETGGMLSHGAVVSREYGIPAVLAVKGATSRLKNGMQVEINGDQGVIKILKPNENAG